jgi:hypothetical protein
LVYPELAAMRIGCLACEDLLRRWQIIFEVHQKVSTAPNNRQNEKMHLTSGFVAVTWIPYRNKGARSISHSKRYLEGVMGTKIATNKRPHPPLCCTPRHIHRTGIAQTPATTIIPSIMKLTIIFILSVIAAVSAFAPAPSAKSSTALHAEQSRKAFFSAAAMSVFGAAVAPAFAMDQTLITDPTERWETGKPTPKAEAARMSRFKNARTQLTSNFPPIKRLTLERKSPVVCDMLTCVLLYMCCVVLSSQGIFMVDGMIGVALCKEILACAGMSV